MGIEAAIIGAALIGGGASVIQGAKAADAQKDAAKQAQKQATEQAKQADQQMNAANQKRPDTSAILSAAAQSGKAGASGTMLTGPQGVDPNALALGKSTLLGQ